MRKYLALKQLPSKLFLFFLIINYCDRSFCHDPESWDLSSRVVSVLWILVWRRGRPRWCLTNPEDADGHILDSLFVNCRSPIFEFVIVVSCRRSGLVFLCLGQNELSDSQMMQSSLLLLVVQFVFCNNNQSQHQFSHVISNNKIIIHIILFIYIMKSLSQF
jgi:hypothetical protein